MSLARALPLPLAAALLVLLASLLAPAAASPGPAAFQAAPLTAAIAFQQAASPAAPAFPPAAPAGGGAAPRSNLPSSVMPHTNTLCSAQHDTPPFKCSVAPNQPGFKCSAHCDSGQQCSAFSGPPGTTGVVRCSVFSKNFHRCSVLPPDIQNGLPAFCSAHNELQTSTILCSIMKQGIGQKCSARNPSVDPNRCSAESFNGASAVCSALDGGTTNNNFCSVKFPGPKTCSTYTDNSDCSVALLQKAVCTSFTGASLAACSVQVGNGTCSVIGGSGGNPCIQP